MAARPGGGYLAKGFRGSGEEPDITTGLTGYYDFNNSLANKASGGSEATLKSGGDANNPELWNTPASGSAVYVDSKDGLGKAYHFLGDKDNIRGEGLKLDVPLTKEFTISYLVNPNIVNFASSMVFSPVSVEEGLNIADNWGGSTFPTVRLWGNGETYLDNFISAADGLCNQWSYIILTCDANGTFNLYINGEKIDGDKTNSAIATDLAGKEIFLGVNYWDASFNGLMDEVRIYNRALTESDITGLCETVGITVTPPETSGPDDTTIPPTNNPPVQPGDWPDVTELDCKAFWGVHTKGIAVGNDGVTVKFSNKTNGTNNWNTPVYVIYTSDEAKVNGAGYTEYGVMRSDVHGWDGAGKTGTMSWKAGTDPIDFAKWLADNKAGANYEVSAIRKENTVFMKINAGGLVTYAAIPVKEGKTAYLALTGEQCKLENISKADYVSFEVPGELANVTPEKPKPLAPYPVVLPTPEPLPTLPPADENATPEPTPVLEPETITGTEWWAATNERSRDYVLKGAGSMDLYVTFESTSDSNGYGAFNVELVSDGNKYITTGSDINAWTAEEGKGTISGAVNTGSVIIPGHVYKITVKRTNYDFTITYYDLTDNKEYCTMEVKDTNQGIDVNVHVMAQVGKYIVSQKAPDVVAPSESATPAPSADPEASPDPSATAEPGNTEAPGTTDPGTNPGDKDPGTTDPGTDNPAENPSDDDDKKDNETKKTMKVSGITAKAGKKKVTGNLSVKGAKVTVKIGSKKAKNAKVSGKKFTFTASSKLKKGTKVTIKVTKSGYKAVTKTVKVK